MTFESSAPSNIALIKYMGKLSQDSNRPTNSSLSWTIESMRSFVRITEDQNLPDDQWKPLLRDDLVALHLSEKGQQRFLKHFKNIKKQFGIQGNYLIESGNNFPSDCGLASSASSFAALTKVAVKAFANHHSEAADLNDLEQAELSRLGSGSSCRSFFGPWSLWFSEGVRPLEFPISQLRHQVLIIEDEIKKVSSSEAHQRVTTSPLFVGRPQRAEARLADLMVVFKHIEQEGAWKSAFEIVWDEFLDMHALFETSQQPFTYMTSKTKESLKFLRDYWDQNQDGPLVTMDAGANIHLLYRDDQKALQEKFSQHFKVQFPVYESLKN